MIKARVCKHAAATGATDDEAEHLRLAVSGHSLRAGVITTMALGGTPEWKIRQHSRHKSADMVARYVRASAAWTDSSIKGVGF
jgi:integrase